MDARDEGLRDSPAGYEPPRIERELTPRELLNEVLYAGPTSTQDGTS
jgi:hypothetical protein